MLGILSCLMIMPSSSRLTALVQLIKKRRQIKLEKRNGNAEVDVGMSQSILHAAEGKLGFAS